MSQNTEETCPEKEPVAYQSISLSDDEEMVGQETPADFNASWKKDDADVSGNENGEDGGKTDQDLIYTDALGWGHEKDEEGGEKCYEDNGFENSGSLKDLYNDHQNVGWENCGAADNGTENSDDCGNIIGDVRETIGCLVDENVDNTVSIDVSTYTCKLCKSQFTDKHQVENHLMIEHDLGEQTALFTLLPLKKNKRVWRKGKDGYFHCLFCSHRSRRSINVREHEKQKHADEEFPLQLRSYACKLCNKQFAIEEIFSHIQNDHPKEADTLNFVGNSLTEHYIVNTTTELRRLSPGDEAATVEMAEDGFYHCPKCDFCSEDLTTFTEHYKDHVSTGKTFYNYCKECPYKSKSLRGLRQHEKMRHVSESVKKRHTICSMCGQKRLINHVHKCPNKAKRGRKPSFLRNADGHLMCDDCTYTVKQYNTMYIHMKTKNHQAKRDPSVVQRTNTPIAMVTENISTSPRILRTKKSDCIDAATNANIDETNGDDLESDVDGNQDREIAMKMQEENDSEFSQQSNLDDSDEDPEWAPSLKGTPPRKSKTRSKIAKCDSDLDSSDENIARKRRPSGDENGHGTKRRRVVDIPKDPESPSPKKLESGLFGCNFCDFESKYGQSTEAHQWRHTGFKPYKCEKCSKGFRQRLSMEKHSCSQTSSSLENEEKRQTDTTISVPSPILLTAQDATSVDQSDIVITPAEQLMPNAQTPRNYSPPNYPTPTEAAALGNENRQEEPCNSPIAIDKETNEVTSPMPIIIQPPISMPSNKRSTSNLENNVNDGRDISKAIDLDDEDDLEDVSDVVCNLDGNEDMPPSAPTPPQGLHHPSVSTSQVGITSPAITPLNIAPIAGIDHHNPHMSGMNNYPSSDGPRFGMHHNQTSMMDMPMTENMMSSMPGMMGDGHMMHHHGTPSIHAGIQHTDMAGMPPHHHNPMGSHGMLEGGHQFQNPDVGILEHLNIMPNTMMSQSGGFTVPQPPPHLPPLESNIMPMNNNLFPSMQMQMYNNSIPASFSNIGNADPIDVDAEPISAFTQPTTTSQTSFDAISQPITSIDSMIDLNRLDSTNQQQNGFNMNPTNTTPVSESSVSGLNVPQVSQRASEQPLSNTNTSSPVATVSSPVGTINSPLSTSTTPLHSQAITPNNDVSHEVAPPNTDSPMLETTDQECVAPEDGLGKSTPSHAIENAEVEGTLLHDSNVEPGSSSNSPQLQGNQVSDTENTPSFANSTDPEKECVTDTENKGGTKSTMGSESEAQREGIIDAEGTLGTDTQESTTHQSTNNVENAIGIDQVEDVSNSGDSNRENVGPPGIADADKLQETSDTSPDASTTEVASIGVSALAIPGGIALSGTDEAPPLTITSVMSTLQPGVESGGMSETNESGKTINDLFKCILCRVYFEDQQMYRNHMVHHGGAIGTCRICGRMFRTPLLFMNHLHCSAQCKGVNVSIPAPQVPMRGRGRGRGSTPQTVGRPMFPTSQVSSTRGRMRAINPMTTSMISPSRMATTPVRGTSPLQAMRQMSPTAGRRGRPPISGRSSSAYGPNLMRQPLQQQHFTTQLQQMNSIRGRPTQPRPMAMPQPQQRHRQPPKQDDIVIVID